MTYEYTSQIIWWHNLRTTKLHNVQIFSRTLLFLIIFCKPEMFCIYPNMELFVLFKFMRNQFSHPYIKIQISPGAMESTTLGTQSVKYFAVQTV